MRRRIKERLAKSKLLTHVLHCVQTTLYIHVVACINIKIRITIRNTISPYLDCTLPNVHKYNTDFIRKMFLQSSMTDSGNAILYSVYVQQIHTSIECDVNATYERVIIHFCYGQYTSINTVWKKNIQREKRFQFKTS